jgi:hypothetical protein
MHYIWHQTSAVTERNPYGTIVEAWYEVDGDTIRLSDKAGRLLDKRKLGPGEDAASAARKLLRSWWKSRGPQNKFRGPLDYGPPVANA